AGVEIQRAFEQNRGQLVSVGHDLAGDLVECRRLAPERASDPCCDRTRALTIEERQDPRSLLSREGGLQRFQKNGTLAPGASGAQQLARASDALVVQRCRKQE